MNSLKLRLKNCRDVKEVIHEIEKLNFKISKEISDEDLWGNYSLKIVFQRNGEKFKFLGIHDSEVRDICILTPFPEELENLQTFD